MDCIMAVGDGPPLIFIMVALRRLKILEYRDAPKMYTGALLALSQTHLSAGCDFLLEFSQNTAAFQFRNRKLQLHTEIKRNH